MLCPAGCDVAYSVLPWFRHNPSHWLPVTACHHFQGTRGRERARELLLEHQGTLDQTAGALLMP